MLNMLSPEATDLSCSNGYGRLVPEKVDALLRTTAYISSEPTPPPTLIVEFVTRAARAIRERLETRREKQ